MAFDDSPETLRQHTLNDEKFQSFSLKLTFVFMLFTLIQ